MKYPVFCAVALASGFLLPASAFGHGGQYRGPGGTVPPGGGGAGGGGTGPTTGPAGPGTGGTTSDLTAWTVWWEFNKEPFLNLKAHVHAGGARTGSEGWYLGRGQRRAELDDLRPGAEQVRQVVVPALLRALATESNNDILSGSMIALAKIGDEPEGADSFEPVLRGFLSNPVQEVRETAAVALGILANDASVPTLGALLADDAQGRELVRAKEVDYRTRSFAAYGLALIGARTQVESVREQVVRRLRAELESDDTRSRDLGVACMIALGLVPLQATAAPSDASRDARIAYLLAYLDDEQHPYLVRAHVPTALARLLAALPAERRALEKPRVARALLARCKRFAGDQKELVQAAALALGAIGDLDQDPIDAEIRAALIELPTHVPDQLARNFALVALGQLGGEIGTSGGVAGGLDQVRTHLLGQLASGRANARPWAALGLGVMGRSLAGIPGAEGSVEAMQTALRASLAAEKSQGLTVGAYAISAGLLRERASAADLLQKLGRMQDDATRGYLAVALGLMDAREAIEPLRAVVAGAEYRPELLKGAAIGLGLLGDKKVVLELVRMLGKARGLAACAAIASALGFIGDRRSIDALVTMLRNDELTDTARGFAAVALGIVADKEPLPWNAKISIGLNYDATTQTLNDASGKGILNIL